MIAIYLSAITDEEEKSKFMMLYDKYAGLMYYTARQLTDDENKAADIVHETFIRIISKLDIIRTENGNETTALIYKMTRYCGIDYLRKEKICCCWMMCRLMKKTQQMTMLWWTQCT